MENQDFRMGIKMVWFLVIGNSLLIMAGAYAKIQHWEFSQVLSTFGLMLFFTSWVIIMSDMVRHKIHHKSFWVFMMFIMPTVATVVYLLQRDRLMMKTKHLFSHR